MAEVELLRRVKEALEGEKPAQSVEMDKEERLQMKNYNLLTMKPMIHIANVSEEEIAAPQDNAYFKLVKEYAAAHNSEVVPICAKVEEELSSLSKEEKRCVYARNGNGGKRSGSGHQNSLSHFGYVYVLNCR